jgi:hypothetical protein
VADGLLAFPVVIVGSSSPKRIALADKVYALLEQKCDGFAAGLVANSDMSMHPWYLFSVRAMLVLDAERKMYGHLNDRFIEDPTQKAAACLCPDSMFSVYAQLLGRLSAVTFEMQGVCPTSDIHGKPQATPIMHEKMRLSSLASTLHYAIEDAYVTEGFFYGGAFLLESDARFEDMGENRLVGSPEAVEHHMTKKVLEMFKVGVFALPVDTDVAAEKMSECLIEHCRFERRSDDVPQE